MSRKGDKLVPPDRYWLEDRVRQAKYKFDSRELSNYLEIGSVKKKFSVPLFVETYA